MRLGSFLYQMRFFAVLLSLLCIFNIALASYPRIALVLSGGGARGLAQIGVLRALEEENIKPDIIIATSVGAIIGSMYSVGVNTDSLEKMAKSFNWDDIFENVAQRRNLLVSQKSEPVNYLFELRFNNDLTPIIPHSISHGQSIYNLLSPILAAPLYHAKMDFDRLPIPLRVTATDIVRGKKMVFSEGNLAKLIRASCGFLLAFSPVLLDSMLLLDGGLTANLPVAEALNENVDYIIAVDVTSPLWRQTDLTNPIRLVDQVIAGGINQQKEIQRELASILIKPNLEGFLNTNYTALDTLITIGYQAAQKVMPTIKNDILHLRANESTSHNNLPVEPLPGPLSFTIRDNNLPPLVNDSINLLLGKWRDSLLSQSSIQTLITDLGTRFNLPFSTLKREEKNSLNSSFVFDPGMIKNIRIKGNDKTSEQLIITASGMKPGIILTQDLIEKAIASIYATNLFYNVDIFVDTLHQVIISVKEKEYWCTKFGLRFDEFHLVEGYIQPAYENLWGKGIGLSLHLQYGSIRKKYAFELVFNKLFTRNWANNLCLQSFIAHEKIIHRYQETVPDTLPDSSIVYNISYDEMNLRKVGVLAKLGTQLGRVAMFDGCIRFERFKISQTLQSSFNDPLGVKFRDGILNLSLSFLIDDLDRFPFPRKGQKHYISIGGASDVIGGTENFVNVQASLSHFFTINDRHTFSHRYMFAWADQSLPPIEQIYLGGVLPKEKFKDISIYNYVPFIGLSPGAISGDVITLMNISYRLAITKKLYFNMLLDWGYAWHKNNSPNEPEFDFNQKTLKYFFNNAPLGFGCSFMMKTIIGPLRLTWGKIISRQDVLEKDFKVYENNVIYFSAGHDF